jgi:hypothetical protein
MNKARDYANNTYEWIDRIRTAQKNLECLDMDEADRKTIFRCLCAEYAEAVERRDHIEWTQRDSKRFSQEDIQIIQVFCKDKCPKTWQEEKLLITELAMKLYRSEKTVKKKAIELGFGKALDYWVNR